MEEMPKIKYLTEDKSGKKLRRNVPVELQELAGRSAWVERVSGSTAELRERANLFAVETDAKIKAHRNQLATTSVTEDVRTSVATGFKIHISKTDVRRLALLHFRQIEEERIRNRVYAQGGKNKSHHAEIVADAVEDYGRALQVAAKGMHREEFDLSSHIIEIALNLLIEDKFLSKSSVDSRFVGRRKTREVLVPPPELLVDPCFELLCRYIEDAEVELAKRRLDALQTGQMPRVQNEFFLPAVTATIPPPGQTHEHQYSIGALIKAFEDAKRDEVTSSRFVQYRIVIRSLTEELGKEFPLGGIDRARCAESRVDPWS